MKKMLIFLFLSLLTLIICFCGCNVKETYALECVSDSIIAQPACYLAMDIPENVFLTESSDMGRYAVFTHEDYEIIQEIFTAEHMDEALFYVSGRHRDDLRPIELQDGSMRFAWTAARETGEIACSAVLFTDGQFYYSVCVRCPAELEKQYREEFSALLSNAALLHV